MSEAKLKKGEKFVQIASGFEGETAIQCLTALTSHGRVFEYCLRKCKWYEIPLPPTEDAKGGRATELELPEGYYEDEDGDLMGPVGSIAYICTQDDVLELANYCMHMDHVPALAIWLMRRAAQGK